ncbi:MAG: TatD family hydrolase [Pyrinomonadaceae bacterium]|nr:TatD family hydrolase [Pyrinomonadaceae bacterium]
MFVDSHAHVDGEEFDADRDEVLERAQAAGVRAILTIGTGDPQSGNFERAVALAEKHANVYASVGVHPHDAQVFDRSASERLLHLVKESSRVVAWGEIGLDYHYDNSPRDVQRAAFVQQLNLAREVKLPVVIHTREADADTMDILESEYGASERGGVMHCFGGSYEMAKRALDLNFMISFAGIITFKKADELRNVARRLPLKRLLIETDCPYLAPVPYRGHRNEPAYVIEVARCLAELHNRKLEEVGEITTNNFANFFRITIA